ncbi:MAG: hypothetical protein WCV91_06630 [Candidatus Margulisiibacteriota bacterium]
MKKLFLAPVILFFFAMLICPVLATDIDPGYTSAFGYGVVIASEKGYPLVDKYDPSQFDYRDNAFHIAAGEGATIDLRMILPKGVKDGDYEAIIKKKLKSNLKHLEKYASYWRIWDLPEGKSWPEKKLTAPDWDPIGDMTYYGDDYSASADWTSSGCKWEDMRESMWSKMSNLKPGDKFLVQYTEGYRANIKTTENKWDDVYKEWRPTAVSTWAFERLEPAIAEGWIVIK